MTGTADGITSVEAVECAGVLMTTPQKSIEDVIRDLVLGGYGQDWGIINSDACRLPEFASYLVANATRLDDEARGELLELVFASAEDVVGEGGRAEDAMRQIERALGACGRGDLVRLIIRHWDEVWGAQLEERVRALQTTLRATDVGQSRAE